MKTIKNSSGLYFVTGKGFTATTQADATKFTNEEAQDAVACIASCGLGTGVLEDVVVVADPNIKQNADGSSFAVSFVRKSQLRSDGSINSHKLNPSKRRFATESEAKHHGNRFVTIEKHVGFYVTTTKDPVNAYVNKVTGKTNPVIGKKRVNR